MHHSGPSLETYRGILRPLCSESGYRCKGHLGPCRGHWGPAGLSSSLILQRLRGDLAELVSRTQPLADST